ncbi:MAG: hypothetical protein KatS3mg132_108 [Limisphaera sp.]|nr:MAG: hypothetical protein KatS3mg132_108 [Limisphaera sp.]
MGDHDPTDRGRRFARLLVVTRPMHAPSHTPPPHRGPVRRCPWVPALIAVAALALGCNRESPPPPAPEPPAGTNTAPTSPQPSAPVSEADAVAVQRLLDFLQSLVQRGQFDQARRAVAELENRPLTPDQRQRLQQLKAQLPPP